jgi:hypothetical protein
MIVRVFPRFATLRNTSGARRVSGGLRLRDSVNAGRWLTNGPFSGSSQQEPAQRGGQRNVQQDYAREPCLIR